MKKDAKGTREEERERRKRSKENGKARREERRGKEGKEGTEEDRGKGRQLRTLHAQHDTDVSHNQEKISEVYLIIAGDRWDGGYLVCPAVPGA